MPDIETVSDLVRQIKLAVQQASLDLNEHGIRIARIELEIKAKLTGTLAAGLKLDIVHIDLSSKIDRSEIQTIRLELTPETPTIELYSSVTDELRSAIKLVCAAAKEAALSDPVFELTKATVELFFGVTSEGKIKVLIGGAAREELTQKVVISLGKNGKSPG